MNEETDEWNDSPVTNNSFDFTSMVKNKISKLRINLNCVIIIVMFFKSHYNPYYYSTKLLCF